MKRTEFQDSTAVAEIHYFPDIRTLEVTFQSGSVYLYADVPASVADNFSAAESAGTFFHDEIRDRYRFRRLR